MRITKRIDLLTTLTTCTAEKNTYNNFTADVDVDVDVDVEDRRAQAYASMPASYICELNLLILMLISNTKFVPYEPKIFNLLI